MKEAAPDMKEHAGEPGNQQEQRSSVMHGHQAGATRGAPVRV